MPQTNPSPLRARPSRGQPMVIPRFALYGEAAAPGQDMLHIESVASRSRLYHWEIEPHVHQGLYQILWLQRGSAEVVLDEWRASVAGPAAIVVPPGVVHGFRFPPDTDGLVLTLSARFLVEGEFQSVGEAFRMTNLDGLQLYQSLITLFATLPRLDRPRALALAEAGAAKGNASQFDLIVTLLDLFLARLARAGTLGQLPPEAAKGEHALISRLSPSPAHARHWADVAQQLGLRARRGKAVNLDPAALLMDMVLKLEETAGSLAHR